MPHRRIILAILAIVLVGISLWVHLGPGEPDYQPPALTVAELGAMKPDLAGDMRLLEELHRRVGLEPDAWRNLPEAGGALYATLWAEEIHRTVSWSQMLTADSPTSGGPTLDEVASAYDRLGQRDAAVAVRALALRFGQANDAFQAWMKRLQAGDRLRQPSTAALEETARAAFAQLAAIRVQRLEYVRSHAADLDIR